MPYPSWPRDQLLRELSQADSLEALLRTYLELNWLRPETALWRTADALTIRALGGSKFDFDLGCGDGLNSYALAGGRLPLEVDCFIETTDVTPEVFFSGDVDIYDAPVQHSLSIPSPPHTIRTGLDHKAHLLERARGLRLYENLVCHDANKSWPVPDASVTSLFSNVVYWLDDIETALAETARVLRPEGSAVLLLPDPRFLASSPARWATERGWGWAEALDRGRAGHVKHVKSEGEWTSLFEAAGLKVTNHMTHLSHRLIEIHEVGLRPISPVLIKMANKLSAVDRAEIKQEWVEYCMALALPMFTSGWLTDRSVPQTFHGFSLSRR